MDSLPKHNPDSNVDDRTVYELFRRQVGLRGSAVACSQENESFTYAELDYVSLRVALALQECGVRAGDIVPILGSRCVEMVACFLAASRMGACYVPFDLESWSQERVDAVLDTVGARVVLFAGNSTCNVNPELDCVRIDRHFLLRSRDCLCDVYGSHPVQSSHLAYIIFTSGTTGKPKGVMVSNESLLNYVKHGSEEEPFNLGVKPADAVLLLFSVAFDACTGVIFSTLCNGGRLLVSSPSRFLEDARECTILPVSPSVLSTIQQSELYPNVRSIFLGGESPTPSLIRKWWAPHRQIFNVFGPTEATIACSMAKLAPDVPIIIGQAMSGMSMRVVDDQLAECPEGEILVAGPGLADGYYKDPDLTMDKFIRVDGMRFYRTGDLGRRTQHGIRFLGRKDSMVKNRGFLVNIEAEVVPALLSLSEVDSAVAFMHGGRLVGVTAPLGSRTLDLRQKLAEQCDHFLIPDLILEMHQLPANANGKVDVQRLKRQLDLDASLNAKSDVPKPDHAGSECPDPNSHFGILRTILATCLGLDENNIAGTVSFWALGGNSLVAIKLISCLHEQGFTIPLTKLFSLPSVLAIADSLSPLYRTEDTSTEDSGDSLPITPVQLGMIRSSIQRPLAGYMLLSIKMRGEILDLAPIELERQWRALLHRHSIFRTVFDMNDNCQKTDSGVIFSWKSVTATANDWDSVHRNEIAALRGLTRDQVRDNIFYPVNACCYITAADEEASGSTLLWLIHHSQTDGWSMSILLRELQALINGDVLASAPQYPMYASRLGGHIKDEETMRISRAFWQQNLEGFHDGSPLNLPQVRASATENPFTDQSINLGLSASELEVGARSLSTSAAVIFHAAWALLLAAYTPTDRVIFGTVLSGRTLPVPSIADIVGPLIHFVPFAVELRGQETKSDLLDRTRSLLLQIADHQTTAVPAIDDVLSGSSSSLFSTALFLEYDLEEVHEPRWTVAREDFPEFGLTAYVRKVEDQICLQLVSDNALHDAGILDAMLCHFRNLVLGLLDPRNRLVEDAQRMMIDPIELISLTNNSRSVVERYSGPSSIREALEVAADNWPDLIAIECPTHSLTYSELDSTANGLALQLAELVEPKQAVTVVADGSIEWLICVVAIMKLAAVYVPLDTKLPTERMDIISRRVDAKVCLIPNEKSESSAPTIDLHKFPAYNYLWPASVRETSRLFRSIEPTDTAYTIFTSGSTGTPKGVCVNHEAVLSYLSYPPARMHAAPGRRHAQMFSAGFDVNIAEIFGTLCYGATLVLKDPTDPYLHLSKVHATMVTPSFLSVCQTEDLKNLDTILFAGEAVPQALSDRWSVDRRVYNSYGPCECTIGALFKFLVPGEPVTLGRPIPRVEVYILDRHARPVPKGVIGELCLSGIQVMHGYLGDDMAQLSATKFRPDAFVVGQRMYKTGDLAFWNSSMEVMFCGRQDNQVKVRGFRVELEEIENAILGADTAITQAATVLVGDNINAFVSPESVDVSRLRAVLRSRLPSYALPSQIMCMSHFPLTNNQKLDRKALPPISSDVESTKSASLSPTERLVAEAWRATANIGPDIPLWPTDDFMAVGGNSLRQIRMAQKLSRQLGFPIPLRTVLQTTILSELASAVDEHRAKSEHSSSVSARPFEPGTGRLAASNCALTHVEEDFYLAHMLSSEPCTYNVACTLELRGDVKVELLLQALSDVVAAHDILNTGYRNIDGVVTRKRCTEPFQVRRETIMKDEEFDVQAWVDAPFDVHGCRLIVAAVVEAPDKVLLSMVQHHLITDHTSFGFLFDAVSLRYEHLLSGVQSQDVNTGHDAWQTPQTAYSPTSSSQHQHYWESQLKQRPMLPFSHGINSLGLDYGESHSFMVASNTAPTSLAQCLSAVARTVYASSGKTDLTIAIPYDRRTEPGTESMLGCFLDLCLVRLTITPAMMKLSSQLHDYAKARLQEALSHAIPYREISNLSASATLFDVVVTYHRREDALDAKLCLPNVTVSEIPARPKGAKFPLLVEFTETHSGLRCDIEYKTAVLNSDRVRRLAETLREVISLSASSSVSTPSEVADLPWEMVTVPAPDPSLEVECTADAEHIDAVREVFAAALGVDVRLVGCDQGYRELGGSPILGARIQWLLRERGFEVALKEIFVRQSPKGIAGYMVATRHRKEA
ncbi:putative non-ribosomal peptide synthetase SirP [Massariosphaeria phaeospora]|uniref:Putative non-ribosomal peptide synthetase SirP n=1 Tax=Massariosphaeria phaeospora TaxID=100035 RepID=A0A7C8I807_9PLEO|nr:putative non-ribosomal peptide synthetase SirP [Massariosphaeria phaeospora]